MKKIIFKFWMLTAVLAIISYVRGLVPDIFISCR